MYRLLNGCKGDDSNRFISITGNQKWKEKYPFTYNETNQLKTQEVLIELNKQITNNMDKYFITTSVNNHQMMS